MKEILLEAPDSQLDASMKPFVEKWSSPPKAIEILEVLDHVINGSLASGLITTVLQNMYTEAIIAEKTTHDEVVKLAKWRGEPEPEPEPSGEVEPIALPEDSGLEWMRKSFFGVSTIDLLHNGTKVGWIIEGLTHDDKIVWTAFDNRTSENGCAPIVKSKVSLVEASQALVDMMVSVLLHDAGSGDR